MSQELEIALDACAREPIHIPGGIQPAGVVIVIDRAVERVLQASANVAEIAGVGPETVVGASPTRVLGRQGAARLRRAINQGVAAAEPVMVRRAVAGHYRYWRCRCWSAEEAIGIDIEPARSPGASATWAARVGRLIAELEACDDQASLLQTLVGHVRRVTGHDRVKIYAFDEDWHGTVIAETRAAHMPSFLHHHFPASDIPPQARAAYAHNVVRMIPDVEGEAVALVPRANPVTDQPLDLTGSVLRAVSPIHLQYLRNMGVGASLSVAIHDNDQLWGLVACHSREARPSEPEGREAAAAITRTAAQRLFALQARKAQQWYGQVRALTTSVMEDTARRSDTGDVLQRHGAALCDLLAASGAVLLADERIDVYGRVPPDETLHALRAGLVAQGAPSVRAIDAHAAMPAPLARDTAAGLLAAPLGPSSDNDWLLLFRPEQHRTVSWAGNPHKPVQQADPDAPLTPRHSFAGWEEVIAGHSQPWTGAECQAAREIAGTLAVIAYSGRIRALNEQLTDQQAALEEANSALQRRADTDALTAMANRARMTRAITDEIKRAARYGRVFSLLILDIDYFKRVNDDFGHDVGDAVLIELARTLHAQVRDTERAGRWGGEEFAVLAPETDMEGALMLGERLRAAIAATPMPDVGGITVSIGTATWRQGETLKEVFRRADHGLYTAKANGRNRVCAGPEPDTNGTAR